MQFPTGGDALGRVHDPVHNRLIWCESKTDSKVWMKEEMKAAPAVFFLCNMPRIRRYGAIFVSWIFGSEGRKSSARSAFDFTRVYNEKIRERVSVTDCEAGRIFESVMKMVSSCYKKKEGLHKKEDKMNNKRFSPHNMAMIGMLSAISFILMFLEFSIPIMPSFIKLDLSELPALIGAFAMGPAEGVLICLFKNLIHLMRTSTGGVGELSNFILGAIFVFVAGLIYKLHKNRKGALIGSLVGALAMAVISVISNYFLVYPFYTNFMPMEAIIAAYQAIYPGTKNLLQALVIFNMPFTFVKGLLDVLVTFLIYKRISPIIKGNR